MECILWVPVKPLKWIILFCLPQENRREAHEMVMLPTPGSSRSSYGKGYGHLPTDTAPGWKGNAVTSVLQKGK